MINKYEKYNPKALNLDFKEDSTSKVTLGFKCLPSLKIQLAKKAVENGLTLSRYTEMVISEREKFSKKIEREIELQKKINASLEAKLALYENDILKNLLSKHNNHEVQYKNEFGDMVNIKIESLQDIYTVIVNSFK